MKEEFLSVKQESNQKSRGRESIKHEESSSIEKKLVITALVLFFIALNVWGYYFYKKGFFGISADVNRNTPAPSFSNLEKPDSVYMIPGV